MGASTLQRALTAPPSGSSFAMSFSAEVTLLNQGDSHVSHRLLWVENFLGFDFAGFFAIFHK
jgi:hypothetical protein